MNNIKLEIGKYYKTKKKERIIKVIGFDKNAIDRYKIITIDYVINSHQIQENRWIEWCGSVEEISKEEALPYFI